MTVDDARLKLLTPAQKRQLLQAALTHRHGAAAEIASPKADRSGAQARWIVRLAHRPAAGRRLICFSDGASDAACFQAWPDMLPPDIEPLVVQRPGLEARASEPLATHFDATVDAIHEALVAWLDRPCIFYGRGLGGALAFATAAALRSRDQRHPEAIVLAAMAPPGRPGGSAAGAPAQDEALVSAWFAHDAAILDVPIVALAGPKDERNAPSGMAGWAAFTRASFSLHADLDGGDPDGSDSAWVIGHLCRAAGSGPVRSRLGAPAAVPAPADGTGLGLSLFFFSANEAEGDADKYRLFDAAVQFADRMGFEGVWIPERHFHPVGGLFPNPSVLAAAVAATTRRLRIRSGSVVLPLHDPVRVAEEWAMVDNLSGGRVDMGVVPGWNPNDYVLAPNAYPDRWSLVFDHLAIVRRLWRGEAVTRTNGAGDPVLVRLHPRPLQRDLPVWVATAANDASFVRAGELGLNILTALLVQPVDAFARRVRLYRDARERAGHDPAAGTVTLMVQAYVGETDDDARRVVREPFLAYMRSVQSLWQDTVQTLRTGSPLDQDLLEGMVFERYFQKSTLFGSVETCLQRAAAFQRAGATELACMIDFGISYERSMANLGGIERLRARLALPAGAGR